MERKSRKVIIHDIRIKEICLPRVCMEVDCSKGTYIRTLCHDIGERLGCGGCMDQLLRTRVGQFPIEKSLRLEQGGTVRKGRQAEGNSDSCGLAFFILQEVQAEAAI